MFAPAPQMSASSFNISHNGYQQFDSLNQVYIRIDSIDLGSFQSTNKATLKACIGSRKSFLPNVYEFHKNDILNHTWTFTFKNANRSSFIFALFKKRIFGGDHEVGEIEVRINAFQPNTVTTEEFILKSPNPNAVPAKVKLTIHVCENGAQEFDAPPSTSINNNFEIPHATTYLSK